MLSRAFLLGCGLTVLGCSGQPAEHDGAFRPQFTSFMATDADFQRYHDWPSFPAGSEEIPASPHLSGPRTLYINRVPPPGSAAFPVGTVILKELGNGPRVERRVFGRVKRGLPFNEQGAAGWEWFELKNMPDGTVTTLWRGVGPPAGDTYGGDPNGCNGCHQAARDNDSVSAPALQLSRF